MTSSPLVDLFSSGEDDTRYTVSTVRSIDPTRGVITIDWNNALTEASYNAGTYAPRINDKVHVISRPSVGIFVVGHAAQSDVVSAPTDDLPDEYVYVLPTSSKTWTKSLVDNTTATTTGELTQGQTAATYNIGYYTYSVPPGFVPPTKYVVRAEMLLKRTNAGTRSISPAITPYTLIDASGEPTLSGGAAILSPLAPSAVRWSSLPQSFWAGVSAGVYLGLAFAPDAATDAQGIAVWGSRTVPVDGTHASGVIRLVLADAPVTAQLTLPAASTPIISSQLGTVTVTWDGKTATGGKMPTGFDHLNVYVNGDLMSRVSERAPSISLSVRTGAFISVTFKTATATNLELAQSAAATLTVLGALDEQDIIDKFAEATGSVSAVVSQIAALNSEIAAATGLSTAASQAATDAFNAAVAAETKAEQARLAVAAAIKDSTIEYAVAGSETVPPTTGWSTSTPTRTPGTFVWMRTVITYGDDHTETANPVLLTGNTGSSGIPGSPGASAYTWLKYADSPTTGMSDLPAGKTYMGIAYNKPSISESAIYTDYTWSLIKGTDGIPGPPGEDGESLYTWIKYGTSAAGAGMADLPDGKTYIGVAYNKPTLTESDIPGDYQWSLIQGPAGANAQTIHLTATTQILVSPASGGVATSPATAVVTGTAVNTTIDKWEYSVNSATFSTTVPAGVARTGNVVTITGLTMTASTIAVKMSNTASGASDTLTVAQVFNGAAGGAGAAGADAYTVLLSNESHTFAGTAAGAVAGGTTSTVLAYKGTSAIAATVGTITGQVTGLTTSVTSNGTTAPVINLTVTTALVATSGILTVPLTVDSKPFTKLISWAVSKTGDIGVSVTAVTPFFKRELTTAPTPAKPTVEAATGWTTTEPSYLASSSLYRTDRVQYSNAAFAFTDVTKVSSYEAAREAWDKAQAAQDAAAKALVDALKYVQSRGTDLVANGTGLLGDNTNFTWATYTKADAPTGITGSFVDETGSNRTEFSTEIIPIDPSKSYVMSLFVRQTLPDFNSRFYAGLAPYDAASFAVSVQCYSYAESSITTLAQPLVAGDTTAVLTSAAGWGTGSYSNAYLGLWDWTDIFGKVWPVGTYTRNTPRAASISGNVVTLTATYTGATVPAGNPVSMNAAGGSYMYAAASNQIALQDWTPYKSGVIGGLQDGRDGTAVSKFPPGTAGVKIMLLTNRPNSQATGGKQAFAGISFSDATAATAIANAKTTTYYLPTATPPTGPFVVGDMWWDTTTKKLNTWSGTWWVVSEDAALTKAVGDIVTAQTVADSKIHLFISDGTTAPVPAISPALTLLDKGDIWIKTPSNVMHTWSGTAWVVADSTAIIDTRTVNSPPSFYWTNYAKNTAYEVKTRAILGIETGTGTVGTLVTVVPGASSTDGQITQSFTIAVTTSEDNITYTRTSTSTTAWTAWINAAAVTATAITNAVNSANGRNSRFTSTLPAVVLPPGIQPPPAATVRPDNGQPFVEGDTWWRVDSLAARNTTGQWVWTSGAWKAEMIRSEVIANVDVVKLTADFGSISLVVANQLASDFGMFGVLTADKLVVMSSDAGLYNDPAFLDAGLSAVRATNSPGITYSAVTKSFTGTGSFFLTQRGLDEGSSLPLIVGDKYSIRVWGTGLTSANKWTISVKLPNGTTTALVTTTYETGLMTAVYIPTAVGARLLVQRTSGSASMTLTRVEVRHGIGGVLIENGAINAEHLGVDTLAVAGAVTIGGLSNAVQDVTAQFATAVSDLNADLSASLVSQDALALERSSLLEAIDLSAAQTQDAIGVASDALADQIAQVKTRLDNNDEYIVLDNNGILLGNLANTFKVQITSTELSFVDNGIVVAYVSNESLYITDTVIRNKLSLGTPETGYFDWEPRSNGNLSFKFSKGNVV